DWVLEKKYIVKYLINNAGYGISGKFEDTTLASYNNMMHLNMHQMVMLTYLFLPSLKKLQSKAYIMNIASAAAYQAVPGLTVYAATKAFVLLFSRGLSAELDGTNIRVTAISPGGTNTHFAERAKVESSYAIKMGKKLNMNASVVAKLAIEAMFAEKRECIIGWVNKLGAFLAWLLPKKIVENSTKKIYLFKD
ncbi:MAG: SDR family NAD(P)-dependent oxidoreductase, partial [Sediminibacterium sp.]|nr:SDR family NAD(P)-dependent oxidoreductase [Sediminibacterium sp.]